MTVVAYPVGSDARIACDLLLVDGCCLLHR